MSVLDDIEITNSSLKKANLIQEQAASLGFDWVNLADVIAKLDEEILEFKQAVTDNSQEQQCEELGDILLTCVNLARHIGIAPDDCLNLSIAKFISRFKKIEPNITENIENKTPLSLDEMEGLWQQAK